MTSAKRPNPLAASMAANTRVATPVASMPPTEKASIRPVEKYSVVPNESGCGWSPACRPLKINAKPRMSPNPQSTSSATSIIGAKAASAVSRFCSRLGTLASFRHRRHAPRMSQKLRRTRPTAGRGMTTDWNTS